MDYKRREDGLWKSTFDTMLTLAVWEQPKPTETAPGQPPRRLFYSISVDH